MKIKTSIKMLPIDIDQERLDLILKKSSKEKRNAMAFVVGTKPCFNKVYGAVKNCAKKGIPFFIINANQHYDDNLIKMIEEFELKQYILVNLNIRGDLSQKFNELCIKTAEFALYLKSNWPKSNVVPILLGDTILCPAISSSWMLATSQKSIHLEAGLRSMSPDFFNTPKLHIIKNINISDFINRQIEGTWQLIKNEPYPEQWNTFTASASCNYFFAPIEINKKNLIIEGYDQEKIFLTGGLITDAIEKTSNNKKKGQIFKMYPQLKNGQWIRIDIHRRDNMTKERFLNVFEAMGKLAQSGLCINLVLLNTFKIAIKAYSLEKRLAKLSRLENFLVTEVWPFYSDVYDFYKSDNFLCAITDSGGVQEDMNIIGKPCITIRFSTDRPETIKKNGGNILVPPTNSDFVANTILRIINNRPTLDKMRQSPKVYGKNAGSKIADILEKISFNVFSNKN